MFSGLGSKQNLWNIELHERVQPKVTTVVTSTFWTPLKHGSFWKKFVVVVVVVHFGRWFFTTSLYRSPDFQNVAKNLEKTKNDWSTYPFSNNHTPPFEKQRVLHWMIQVPKRWSLNQRGGAFEWEKKGWRIFPMKGEMNIFSIGGLELGFLKIELKLMLGNVYLHVVVFLGVFPSLLEQLSVSNRRFIDLRLAS